MIDFTSLYKKVDDMLDKEEFGPALTLLRDTAHRILEGEKLLISKEEIEEFLKEARSAIRWAANYHREAFWDRDLQVLGADIEMTGLKIIRKYDVQDVSVKISYVRSASSLEKDPVKVAALDKEFDELSALYAAQSRRKKL
jgi:hypothetical protein